jgi:putative ABC transport system ATP-binding protein
MAENGQALIKLDGVTKVFFTDEVETHALSGVHLEIQHGEYVSIAGPSGCGKTTLLSILGLLDSPTEGSYTLEGQPVAKLSAAERARVRNRQIGFIFQAFNLIGDLTVYENVELPLTYRGMNGEERRRRVQSALERVGMSHRMKHFPAQLSGGQQQRVAVARAIAGSPSVLLADEPTGNLDSANGEQVMDLLRELHGQGSTIVMVTHDPRYAEYADRTIHLFDGRVVEAIPAGHEHPAMAMA